MSAASATDEIGRSPPGKRYEVTLSKIVAAPRAAVWAAWQDPGTLALWLPDAKFEISKTVPHRRSCISSGPARRAWRSGFTSAAARPAWSCRTGSGGRRSARLQDYWSAALDRLQVLVAR
jgi:hypothetical protein